MIKGQHVVFTRRDHDNNDSTEARNNIVRNTERTRKKIGTLPTCGCADSAEFSR
jgi:hypothetical protein